jgi:GntR family transcriptional repressor for pyruvate dehydrogenase complex
MADSAGSERGIFEQIDLDRVADAVVHQIERLIVAGVLRPGQKLPPERELAEEFGISRPKLREAFGVLASRDLIEIRRSEGAFIRPITSAALSPAMIELFARHREAFLDFLEYRREQESFAAHLAAQRATDADHEAIALLLAEMEEADLANDPDREAELDLRFHMAVVEAAHNAMLVHVMRSIYALMTRGVAHTRRFLESRAAARGILLAQHREIAEAVMRGDAAGAAEAAERHIDHVAHAYRTAEDEDRRRAVARKRRCLAGPPAPSARRRG